MTHEQTGHPEPYAEEGGEGEREEKEKIDNEKQGLEVFGMYSMNGWSVSSARKAHEFSAPAEHRGS